MIFPFDNLFINLRKLFSKLTDLRFEISFLLGLPVSSGTTDVALAFSGKAFRVMLALIAFVSNGVKKLTEIFMSLAGIASMPHSPFLYLDLSQSF